MRPLRRSQSCTLQPETRYHLFKSLTPDSKLTPSQFEMAMEETENKTIYAEADREAAREELTRVQEAYRSIVEGVDTDLAEEVKRRIGQRIRELEAGVQNMEDIAMNQD
jgi:hypothetical protein